MHSGAPLVSGHEVPEAEGLVNRLLQTRNDLAPA